MHYFDSTIIDGEVFIHQIGNKLNGESLVLSSQPLNISEDIKKSLKVYFLSHFKQTEYYTFDNEVSLSMNEVYNYVSAIFDNQSDLAEQSRYLAKTLYRSSMHPNIKCGEFYVVYFKNCLIDGVMTDAVGLFKSENKVPFLKVLRSEHKFEVVQEQGISLNKLDKGCLVFNIQRKDGYVVSVIDNSNKKGEAKYWIEDFLHLKLKNDAYAKTKNVISLCKQFISQLPENVSKADKANMMNRVLDNVKEGEIEINNLATFSFGSDIAKNEFESFKKEFQKTQNVTIESKFTGKPEVLGTRTASSLTTLKLDKNFEVKVHGGDKFIERGFDEEKGMSYYKLFFKEEK